MGGTVHSIKKSTEGLVFCSKDYDLEVNGGRTEYTVMSGDQNVGQVTV
jgi:hypothetical protein